MKICISRMDKMGDMILSLPAIKSLKDCNPNFIIVILASKQNAKILDKIGYIDQIIEIDDNFTIINLIKQILNFRKSRYDLYINLSPSYLSYFYCFFSNSKKKAILIFLSRYKNSYFSKFLLRILSNMFCNYITIINRYERLKKNKEIHQTKMIFKLFKKCNLKYTDKTSIEIKLPKTKIKITNNRQLLVIHIPEKWINKFYNEDNFLELLSLIPHKKYFCVLTSDVTTKNKFHKVFNKYKVINDNKFQTLSTIDDQIIILDKLNYKNWLQIIYSSKLVITPECGCSHIAAASRIPVSIIYDPMNLPDAIHKEYAPWRSAHHKFIFSDDNLNKKLINKLI